MSAIVAAVGKDLSPATKAWVSLAMARAGVAGRDGSGVVFDGRCGLGQALLRTSPDQEAGPATLGEGTWVAADVRLDGRDNLIRELLSRGRRLSPSDPDPKLLLHAYAVWGTACLDHLEGDFAFALWDSSRQRLFCARDQMGIAPLHFARIIDGLLVATAVDALLMHPDVPGTLNEGAVADFLLRGRVDEPGATTFEAVSRLAPAHSLTCWQGDINHRRYWQASEWEPLVRLERASDYAEQFRDLLDEAVADRVTLDRVSVHLSGGMDSSSVAASARVVLDRRGAGPSALHAFTAILGGTSGDQEGYYASQVATALGLPWDVIDGASYPVLDPWAAPLMAGAEPLPYMRTAFQFELARLPAQHGPIVLSGHGGDNLLLSDPSYWAEWLLKGHPIRLGKAYRDEVRLFHTGPRPHLRAAVSAASARMRRGRRPVPAWMDPDFAARSSAQQRTTTLHTAASTRDARALTTGRLWSTWLTWAHPTVTGVPLRLRYPLADLRLARFILRLPPEPWLVGKKLLRDSASQRLPEEVRRRRKTPLVAAPMPGFNAAALGQLASFVREVPGLERFIDREVLASTLNEQDASSAHQREQELSLALGLAHWLAHRRPIGPGLLTARPVAV